LRGSTVEGSVYGELAFSNPTSGDSFKNSYIINLDESWEKDVFPVAILWKKNESGTPQYEFINAIK
jgi:hypothetical protein